FRPRRAPDVHNAIGDRSSMRSCGYSGPGHRGVTSPRTSAPGAPPGTSSTNGPVTGRWTRSCPASVPPVSTPVRSTTSCGASMAHPCALRRRGREKKDPSEPPDHALGRSRGGFSSKFHLLCDGHGHPLHFHLTAGQAHDNTALVPLLEGAEESVVDGEDAPVAWPLALAGDKGYRADWIDAFLLELGITPVIP